MPAEATAEVKSSETKDGGWMGSAVMICVVWTMVSMMWIAFNAVRQIFTPKPKRRQEASETEDEEESQRGEQKGEAETQEDCGRKFPACAARGEQKQQD